MVLLVNYEFSGGGGGGGGGGEGTACSYKYTADIIATKRKVHSSQEPLMI